MANRPIFLPSESSPFFKKKLIDFNWFAGYSIGQKQKSVESLHANAIELELCSSPLEISTKSKVVLGYNLSAFNLKGYSTDPAYSNGCSLETLYQTSKVFNDGTHCTEYLSINPKETRKKIREKEHLGLKEFKEGGTSWPLEPKGCFYNFIYIRSLNQFPEMMEQLSKYDAFTDIEFNPQKSFSCQAEAISIFIGLINAKIDISNVLSSKEKFLNSIYNYKLSQKTSESVSKQSTFFDGLE